MSEKKPKTHRLQASPKMQARMVAEYMAASGQVRRTIVQKCKFRPIARIVQHQEAKMAISRFLRGGSEDIGSLLAAAESLRNRMYDDDFEGETLAVNADYLDRFAETAKFLSMPKADVLAAGKTPPITLAGVEVSVDFAFRLQRTTRTNEIRIGAGSLRYAKGKPLSPEQAAWQSALTLGYLRETQDEKLVPEGKLCLTIDGWTGTAHPSPGDAVRRFKNIEAELQAIAERWDNIKPPPNAVY